jgi:hypothetical protein
MLLTNWLRPFPPAPGSLRCARMKKQEKKQPEQE